MSDRNDKSLVDRLGRFWLIWVFFYLGTGMYAQMQGETSFFAATVDHVRSLTRFISWGILSYQSWSTSLGSPLSAREVALLQGKIKGNVGENSYTFVPNVLADSRA